MRVAVLDSDYLQFLGALYEAQPGLERATYDEQLAVRRATLFGTASSYAAAFREAGHEAHELFLNNGPLQEAWAREHGVRLPPARSRRTPRGLARRVAGGWRGVAEHVVRGVAEPDRMARILLAQLDALRPDLVLNQDLPALSGSLLGEVRARTTALAGQHAAIPLPAAGLDPYDLLVSSFPPTVDELRRRGHRAELSRLGFDPAVLDALGDAPLLRHGLTFVGSLAPIHSSRRSFLEELAQLVPDLRVWTPEPLPRSSSLRGRRAGAVWGREMFEVLRASRATLNHHGDVAPFANNMRLYEATGVGTVLLTDAKQNLTEIFDPGAEVLTFGSAAECAAVYAGLDDTTREAVATAGQRRTLRDHTYRARVEELLALL